MNLTSMVSESRLRPTPRKIQSPYRFLNEARPFPGRPLFHHILFSVVPRVPKLGIPCTPNDA
jgi:hypothetical protein